MSNGRKNGAVERIRVLHFLPWVAGGGVEVGIRELIRGLPAARYEHHIACIEARGPRKKDFEDLGVPLTVFGGKGNIRNLSALARLTQLARAWQPHVLHAAVFEGQVFGTIAGRLAGVPVVVTEEATYPAPPGDRSSVTRVLLGQLLRWNDAAVAIAPSVGRYLVHRNGVPEDSVQVIRYGVAPRVRPPDGVLMEERRALGLPQGKLIVGTVCRLSDRHKRVSDLIRAVARLRDEMPELHLLIVGDGADRQALERLAQALDVADRVHFAGYRADPTNCLYLMDIFALPSAFEGFGIVFVEAALCGLPCIGTAVGGIVDAVEHQVTGLLVPPSDVEALSKAIVELARDPELRRRMGQAGAWRAQRLHSVDGYARAFDQLFLRALSRRGIELRQHA